jgi:hypothetical protein
MRCGDFLVFLAFALGACAGPAAPVQPREPEPHAPAVLPPQHAKAAASQAPVSDAALGERSLRLEPLQPTPAPNPPPVIEIKFPIFAQLIPTAKAHDYRVRLKIENWPLLPRSSGVQIALDEHAPLRVLEADGVQLGSLAAVLSPGEHLLVAWAIRETGEVVRPPPGASRAPYAAVRFSIGDSRRAGVAAEAPVLRYAAPTGTINGDRASDAVLVDYLPLFAELSAAQPLRVKIQGAGAGAPPWTAELVQSVWAPVAVRGLPSGDWKITLEHATNRVAEMITVNRDLAPALVR